MKKMMQSKYPKMLVVERARILDKKQKFMNLIQKILRRTRQERQGILEIRNIVINEDKKMAQEEQKCQRKFYAVMRSKHQLEVQLKAKMQELKRKRTANNNIIHKQLQTNIALQKGLNKSRAHAKRARKSRQLRKKMQRRYH